jgi:uncharacterized iron-regulated protein
MARVVLLALAIGALGVGCATTSSAGPDGAGPAPTVPPSERPVPAERDPESVSIGELNFDDPDELAFVDGRTGKTLSFAEVAERVRAADIVLAAEQHTNATHHRLQARVVDALRGVSGSVAVGLEMVTWPGQAALDRFSKGEIDVDGLFAAVDWDKTWRHDKDLYRPIFESGKNAKARFVALNAPRELVRAVAKKGVDGLSDEERAQLPELDLEDEVHRSEIQAVFQMHHPPSHSGGAFANFYAAQVLWDESMADRSVRALEGGADKVVVMAGVGHIDGYRGIPQRILRRRPDAKLLTVVPVGGDDGESAEDIARGAVARAAGDILVIKKPKQVIHL